jgi:hypothetical protein
LIEFARWMRMNLNSAQPAVVEEGTTVIASGAQPGVPPTHRYSSPSAAMRP